MGNVEQPRAQPNGGGELCSPAHTYMAYVFDQAETRWADVQAVLEEAQKLGHPMRYWWLSDAMDLSNEQSANFDRLILAVHFPSNHFQTGEDLAQALEGRQSKWDELERATLEEYVGFGRPVMDKSGFQKPDGQPLFPEPPPEFLETDATLKLTVGDVQNTALEAIGRVLTGKELQTVTQTLQELIDEKLIGLITRLEREAGDTNPTPETETSTDYLVQYRLTGMTMIQALNAKLANRAIFNTLLGMIRRVGSSGVTPQDVSALRLPELEVEIESVEAMPFEVGDMAWQ